MIQKIKSKFLRIVRGIDVIPFVFAVWIIVSLDLAAGAILSLLFSSLIPFVLALAAILITLILSAIVAGIIFLGR